MPSAPRCGPLNETFSGDATRLVTVGQIWAARVWDVSAAGRGEVLTLPGPESGPVPPAIAFTPDGRRLVASLGPAGGTVVSGTPNPELSSSPIVVRGRHCASRRDCAVNRAVFSPDGTKIATTGADATVRIMTADTGPELRVLRAHGPVGSGTYSVEWSTDGKRLLAFGKSGARVWDVASG